MYVCMRFGTTKAQLRVCMYVCMTKLSYRLFDIHLPAVNTTARF